jgi:two-component system, chemotaxis family, CheB/CheR fusion protein
MSVRGIEGGETAKTIVAFCASATSERELASILLKIPSDLSTAFVLVLQHREALDVEAFRKDVAAVERAITPIKDGDVIEPGRFYLNEPNTIVEVDDGRFRSRPAEQEPGARGTIDSFLVSLARQEDGRAIVVLLAGTGGDGTLGVKVVKEAGGIALAEESEEVRAGELAHSNSPAALADAVLPLDKLAERIVLHVRQIAQMDREEVPDTTDVSAALKSIAGILRNRTGHDFHGYKQGTFLRRVQRRMQVVQVDNLGRYINFLRTQPEEVQQLFNDLLIGVTQFFRDAKEFELLEREVVPKLFEGKIQADQLRVWVIGCSTGEEAYSIAILLREHMAKLDEVPQVQIFATDLDGRALAAARAGRYPSDIVTDVTPPRLARWFVKEGNTYCVAKDLREMCIFSQHNIIKDAPFSRLDLVSCRNLLIYLDADVQSRVIPLFHFALKRGGILFLGNSENVSRHTNLFAAIESRFRIFRKLETGARVLPDFHFTAVDQRVSEPTRIAARSRPLEASLEKRAERIAERYAPAYVIVDEGHNVLHFSGRTGRFIDPAGGIATLALLNLVHPDLRLDLRAALAKAAEHRQTTMAQNIRMGANGKATLVDLVVEPLQDSSSLPLNFVILFKDVASLDDADGEGATRPLIRHDDGVLRLEGELRDTRERLQATNEELESTNEELKSSNEEYQSLNEELQSANEELETSKEELQSVNEELTTVNGELAHRVHELARANSDLKNLLESTQIATIFLDNELRVMNFTPAVAEIFHLVETDIGRPIGHIKFRVSYEELQDDVRKVLRTLGSVEREVENLSAGTRYMARVLPYRSLDNFIGGAVITFTSITLLTRAQQALRESEERFRAVAEQAEVGIAMLTLDGRLNFANDRLCEMVGRPRDEVLGRTVGEFTHPDDWVENEPLFRSMLTQGEPFTIEMRFVRPDATSIWSRNAISARRDSDGRIVGGFAVAIDMSNRKAAEDRLRASESQAKLLLAELQHRVRNTLSVVRSIAKRTQASAATVEDYASLFDGRLSAFARVQASLTKDPSSGIDLEALIRQEVLAHSPKGDEQTLRIEGPPIKLQPAAAESLGLAVHELATNAVKYGALSSERGRVAVLWTIDPGTHDVPYLVLTWEETGVNMPRGAPARRGFGTELIERVLAYELKATSSLDYTKTGLHCTISIPLTDQIRMPREE